MPRQVTFGGRKYAVPLRFCDEDCNNCDIHAHRQFSLLINILHDRFGGEVYRITQAVCPNMTCCADCNIDDFCHDGGCEIANEADALVKAWSKAEGDAGCGAGSARRSAPGNAAAMREALGYVLQFDATDEAAEEDGLTDAERIAEYADHIEECQKKARAALSAPPRNCDRFDDEQDAQLAFLNEEWLISVDKDSMLERDRFDNWTDEMRSAYARWLMAKAEGGAE